MECSTAVADMRCTRPDIATGLHAISSWPPARPTACCPFAGWTLPGVFTLGGAQVALKSQGCAIGERVVFMGTGPLLYLVA